MTDYTRSTKRASGTSLKYVIASLSEESVSHHFGKPDADGYYDPERGYEGIDYTFEDASGEPVTLYARFGEFRIGARSWEAADTFYKFITRKVFGRD